MFIGLATLFAELLRPLTPTRGPVQAQPTEVPRAIAERREPARPAATVAPAAQPARAELATANVTRPPAPPIPDGPLVAIVLTELGPNASSAKAAIETLAPGVSLAFSPYADASRGLAAEARKGGHEVWLSVPMQPKSYPRVSPGKNVLLAGESPAENIRRLEWALSRVDAPVGITNMMGSAFTEDAAAMRPVLDAVRTKRLAYVDARSSGKSVGEREARAAGVPAATNDRFLDEPDTAANIRRNLNELVATAKRRGFAVGYGRAMPETIRQIDAWSRELDAQGVTLVGASVIARKNTNG